jgi:Flp pilus assembly pilin Flp
MNEAIRLMWSDEEGQDLAEYALLLVLVAITIVTGIGLFRAQIIAAFSRAASVMGS